MALLANQLSVACRARPLRWGTAISRPASPASTRPEAAHRIAATALPPDRYIRLLYNAGSRWSDCGLSPPARQNIHPSLFCWPVSFAVAGWPDNA
jgi:hypothetical protein